tara:strand:+ start:364 stop:537 length:174 start_codon:yes stop_codon:yes gene_type:complete
LETKYAKNDRRYPSNIENITIICKKWQNKVVFDPKTSLFDNIETKYGENYHRYPSRI